MTLNTLSARRERERNLLFLSSPWLWPAYPFLPVVRRTTPGGLECGLMFDARRLFGLTGYGSTVWLCNIFAVPPDVSAFLRLPRETFDSCEEVFAAGWRID